MSAFTLTQHIHICTHTSAYSHPHAHPHLHMHICIICTYMPIYVNTHTMTKTAMQCVVLCTFSDAGTQSNTHSISVRIGTCRHVRLPSLLVAYRATYLRQSGGQTQRRRLARKCVGRSHGRRYIRFAVIWRKRRSRTDIDIIANSDVYIDIDTKSPCGIKLSSRHL